MPETISQELTPGLIPKPRKQELEDMQMYYSYFENNKERLYKDLLKELVNHPVWGPIMKNTSPEVQEARSELSEKLQRQAIFDNNWEPYISDLIQQGIVYATMGVSFSGWFELINMHRNNLTVLLLNDKDPRGINILNGLNSFVDIALSVTGEAYLAEKKSIVEKQKREQEFLNKELEQFLYIATHDLKEPLRNVTSYVELLEKKFGKELGEEGKQYLAYIGTSADLMRELVSGLMEYSIIGNAKNEQAVKTDLNDLFKNVVSNLQSIIEDRKVHLDIGKLPTLKIYQREITLLFQNLISNAIKFTKPSINPDISVTAEKKNNGWLFKIKDNGIGIDEKYFEKIFVIFQRLNPRSKYAGTGIGLAHCKKIVELHNGKIWVESKPGEGSSFYFTINEI